MTEQTGHTALVEALDSWFGLFVRKKSTHGIDVECLRRAPRIAAYLPSDGPELTREMLMDAATRYLEDELERLAPYCPNGNGDLTRLQALRLQYLKGQTTKEIVFDHPISRSGYFELRRSALELLAERAHDPLDENRSEEDGPANPASTGRADESSRSSHRRPLWIAGLGAALVLIAWMVTEPPRASDPTLPKPRVGQSVYWQVDGDRYAPIFPNMQVPEDVSKLTWAVFVPGDGPAPSLVVGSLPNLGAPGTLARWDEEDTQPRWRLDWRPPAAEVVMYDLEEQARDEAYWPDQLYWGRDSMNLGPYVAVTYAQMWAPSFAVVVDYTTGTVVRRYGHPGRLEGGGIVGDVDANGTAEVILGGQDNVLDRAVVVLLEVPGTNGAASTTRLGAGQEGAFGRVILPDLPRFREALGLNRFLARLETEAWARERGRLTVHVGGARGGELVQAYICYLDLRGTPRASILVGDSAAPWWSESGLDPQVELEGAESQVQFLGRLWE